MATMTTTLRRQADSNNPPTTTERKLNAETQLRRNLQITDSVRERVRTNLIDVQIEDSPIKRERTRERDEQVPLPSRFRLIM